MRGLVLVTALLCTTSPVLAETRRLAIVVGNNAGNGDLAPLRFAESDAGKMARVLVELGDVNPDDVMLLQGRHADDLERAITEARERIAFFKKSPEIRTVLMFYFSGHSDGEAIELGNEKLAYARLKSLLAGTKADVRLVIVDACRSGAGLREKGGKPSTAFTIRLADTLQATGEAFITSSAADEAALESSEVMGSYFTHNFISGLRGAADTSGDKQVTLAEAYHYAYDRTVTATAMLSVGAQHPNYDFKLSGQGELVLSNLTRPSSLLVLPEADRSLVTDLARDQVIVEVPTGQAREIALPAGQYGLRVFKGGQSFGGRVTLVEGARKIVAMEELTLSTSSVMVAAKGGPSVSAPIAWPDPGARETALGVGVGATGRVLLDPALTGGPKWQLRVSWEPFTNHLASFGPFRLVGQLRVLGLAEMSFDSTPTNEAGMQVHVGYQLGLEVWRLSLSIGAEVGPGFLAQMYGKLSASLVLTATPQAMLRVRFGPGIAAFVAVDYVVLGAPIVDVGWQGYGFVIPNAGLTFFF